jgi:hypothetical protein
VWVPVGEDAELWVRVLAVRALEGVDLERECRA